MKNKKAALLFEKKKSSPLSCAVFRVANIY